MKTIVVACGTGIATSTVLNDAIENLLRENRIKANIIQCKISELDAYIDNADLIVTSMKFKKDLGKPTVLGIGYLTGIGVDEINATILSYMKG